MLKMILTAGGVCALAMLPDGRAATFYVAPTGNDAAQKGSLEQPFKTLGKGAAMLKAPGDTLYLRGGVYQDQTMAVTASGTATAPIKILAYPGERPVIEGQNRTQPGRGYRSLVTLGGNYLVLSGLETRYATGRGVLVTGSFDRVTHVFSHHNYVEGIMVTGAGRSNIVEDCDVWWNVCQNEYAGNAKAGKNWATGLCSARAPRGTILRRNKVHDNWGEGLDTYEAADTVIEDNVIWDNWSVNLYTSDTPNSVVRRNLVYNTPHSPVAQSITPEVVAKVGDRVACGIGFCDEVAASGRCAYSTNVLICNNVVMGCNGNFHYWNQDRGSAFTKRLQEQNLVHATGLQGCLIAFNTFINSMDPTTNRMPRANCDIGKGAHRNSRFVNNLFVQENAARLANVVNDPELHFSHNLWSAKTPPQATGPGDVIGQPQLAKTGATGPGQLTADWFKLTAGSPAIGHAEVLAEIKDDLGGKVRGSHPSIGASEFKP